MWNIFGRYRGKKVLPSARQMNLIASILNHVAQGTGIAMETPQQPSTDAPWKIGIDVDWLNEFLDGRRVTANSIVKTDADGKLDALCSLLQTAPSSDKVLTVKQGGTSVTWEDISNHEHTTDDITDWDDATSDFLTDDDVGTTVAAYNHTHDEYAEVNHTHTASQITGLPDLSGCLTTDDIGDTVQAHSAKLDALNTALDATGKVPLSQLTGNISGHSGNCLVTINNSGALDHGGNDSYDVLMALTGKSTVSNHDVTLPFPEWADNATKQNVLVGTDASGDLKNLVTLLTTAPSTDKVLTVKKNGTVLSWEDGGGSAENPTNATILNSQFPSTATALTNTWTSGGNNGLVLSVQVRTVWDGSKLYGFYRNVKIDKRGMVYSVGLENRYEIDTPVKITWS